MITTRRSQKCFFKFKMSADGQAYSRKVVNQGKGVPQAVHPIVLHWDERRAHVLFFPLGVPVFQVLPMPARGKHLETGSKEMETST